MKALKVLAYGTGAFALGLAVAGAVIVIDAVFQVLKESGDPFEVGEEAWEAMQLAIQEEWDDFLGDTRLA